MLVIEGERLVIVVDLGQIGVAEDLGENRQTPALLGDDLAIGLALPAAAPALLVLPILGIADAFVEVHHHRDLRTDLHETVSLTAPWTGLEWSSHSTLVSLRTMTNSSRLEPTVP